MITMNRFTLANRSPFLLGIILLAFLRTSVSQQLLVYGSDALPTCAKQCDALQEAQTGCIPPAAPVTDLATYESCFCQSGYLTTIETDPATACGSVCSGSDLTQISTWYKSNCIDDGAAAAAAASTAASSTTASATGTSTDSTSTATSSSTSSVSGQSTGQQENKGWWAKHWKWVMMAILIMALLILYAIIAVLIRRHIRRRQDRTKGRFNDGITNRSMAVTPIVAGSRGPYGQDRAPPSASGRHNYSQSRMESAASLSRVREAPMMPDLMMSGGQYSRGSTPMEELERGRKLKKGKGRARADVEESKPAS